MPTKCWRTYNFEVTQVGTPLACVVGPTYFPMIRVFNQYISPKSIVLMALEGVLIIASLWSAAKFRFWADPLAFSAYVDAPGFLLQALTVVLVLEKGILAHRQIGRA